MTTRFVFTIAAGIFALLIRDTGIHVHDALPFREGPGARGLQL